jgi:hypothetical protein
MGGPLRTGDDLFRVFDRDEHNREHAAHVRQRAAHRIFQTVVSHLALNQVRDDFCVGFGLEFVSLRLQLLFQVKVVFDDAVVHNHDAACAVAVRMGILLGGAAMCRPSRVADAVQPFDGFHTNRLLEVGELASGPA